MREREFMTKNKQCEKNNFRRDGLKKTTRDDGQTEPRCETKESSWSLPRLLRLPCTPPTSAIRIASCSGRSLPCWYPLPFFPTAFARALPTDLAFATGNHGPSSPLCVPLATISVPDHDRPSQQQQPGARNSRGGGGEGGGAADEGEDGKDAHG